MNSQSNLVLISRIESCSGAFTKTERKIADYIKQHTDLVGTLSAKELSIAAGTGVASVMRFCKTCGFSGFSELKLSLKHEIIEVNGVNDMNIYPDDSSSVIKQKVLNYNHAVLTAMSSVWNENELELAATSLMNAGKVIASGAGTSRTMALMFYDSCMRLNIPCTYHNDLVDEICAVGSLNPGDVLVGFTYSGKFSSTIENFKLAREKGATTIGILGRRNSPACDYVDIALFTSDIESGFYFGSQKNLIGDFLLIEILHTIMATRSGDLSAHENERWSYIKRHRID